MARKQLPSGRSRNPNNNSTSPATTKAKTKNSPKTIAKSSNGSRNRIMEAANGDASSEDTEVSVVPSSSVESENDEATESSEAEDDGVEQKSSSNEEEEEEEEEVEEVEEEEEEEGGEGEGEEEEEEEEEDEQKKPETVDRKGKRDNAKSKGKKRSRKEEDESEAEEKGENAQYVFPMKRINRIAKVDNPDRKFFQEAVFVINRASEKFLQVFCKEAYACAFLEKKKQIAYNHLSSVVSKRERFQFVSDFVPEKTKAKDALALGEEAEMTKAKEK